MAAKLIIAIGGLMLIGSAVVGVLFYNYERDIAFKNLFEHNRFTSDMVLNSLRSDMLNADKADINRTMKHFSSARGIRGVLIHAPDGRTIYSSLKDMSASPASTDPNAVEVAISQKSRLAIVKDDKATEVLNYYTPIPNEPSCYSAKCHYHSDATPTLGVLQTRINSKHIEGASRQMLVTAAVLGIFFIISISIFLFIINYLLVTRPMAILEKGMRSLANGSFDSPIQIKTNDEMGRLARNFNTMAHDIQRYKDKLENWAKELQDEVAIKTNEIKDAQDQLVNAEKLASLGRLSAGVAHEINNPLTGIVTFAHLMLERCPEDKPEDHEDLTMIIEQADRCTKIVKGLLGFSRKGGSEKTLCNINGLIENSYSMVRNQSAFHDIQVALKLADRMPHIDVDPNQIQQVLLNLFTNASDAMQGIGQITVETRTLTEDGTEYTETTFTDTGPGILPEHMSKILEPFFTTKEVGKGTGLGLPVSYGIIKRHGGELFVKSKVGHGTTFIIRIPVAGQAEDDKGGKSD